MPNERNKALKEQLDPPDEPAKVPAKPAPESWLTALLADPNAIDAKAWSALQPPHPKNSQEKKALERVLTIGGHTVTIFELRKQLLIELVESKALQILLGIDEEKIKKCSVQQAAVAFGILTDKARLLRGEPTAIYRHEDVRKLDDLGRALMKEMNRRGITIENEPEEIQ